MGCGVCVWEVMEVVVVWVVCVWRAIRFSAEVLDRTHSFTHSLIHSTLTHALTNSLTQKRWWG